MNNNINNVDNQQNIIKRRKFLNIMVLGILPLTIIGGLYYLNNTSGSRAIRKSQYINTTIEDMVSNPNNYNDKLVSISSENIYWSNYEIKDTGTLYKILKLEDNNQYANRLQLFSELKGDITTNLNCEFFSDHNTSDYKEVDKLLKKINSDDKVILKGKILSIDVYKENKKIILSGFSYNTKTKEITKLPDEVSDAPKLNNILLRGYTIEINGKEFYIGDVK